MITPNTIIMAYWLQVVGLRYPWLPRTGPSGGAGRLSPPPIDPAELAGGEFEVVHEDEDRRMVELLRAQVGGKWDQYDPKRMLAVYIGVM